MKDIRKHIFGGAAVAVAIGFVPYLATYNLFTGLWGCLAGVIAGLVKEWTDYQNDCKFDWRDFAATCLGSVIVAVVIVLMHFAKG